MNEIDAVGILGSERKRSEQCWASRWREASRAERLYNAEHVSEPSFTKRTSEASKHTEWSELAQHIARRFPTGSSSSLGMMTTVFREEEFSVSRELMTKCNCQINLVNRLEHHHWELRKLMSGWNNSTTKIKARKWEVRFWHRTILQVFHNHIYTISNMHYSLESNVFPSQFFQCKGLT